MNSHITRPAAMQAEATSAARGYHTPRSLAIVNNHAALMAKEDHDYAQRSYDTQRAKVDDLRRRLAAAEVQLSIDAEQLQEDISHAALVEYAAQRAHDHMIAISTAARQRAADGMPNIRPLPALAYQKQPKVTKITIPSRCKANPNLRPALVETAWRRRRRWSALQAHQRPAGKQAFLEWQRHMLAVARAH